MRAEIAREIADLMQELLKQFLVAITLIKSEEEFMKDIKKPEFMLEAMRGRRGFIELYSYMIGYFSLAPGS